VSPRGNGRRLRGRGAATGVAAPVMRPARVVVSVIVAACITPPPAFA
jgi:hypothetical protein